MSKVKKYEENTKKYEGNTKKYEGKMYKYEEKMKKYEGKMKNYEGKWRHMFLHIQAVGLGKILGLPAGGMVGKSYTDTIPEMAPSTEREGKSPAKICYPKKQHLTRVNDKYVYHLFAGGSDNIPKLRENDVYG